MPTTLLDSLRSACLGLFLAVAAFTATPASAQTGANGIDWPYYGGDAGSTKYAPATQIDRDTVANLAIEWTWDSPDNGAAPVSGVSKGTFENTPLAIRGRLYVTTSFNRAVCINGANGKTIWQYDPQAYLAGTPPNLGFVHRGLAYWTDGEQERVIYGTADDKLISLDAMTGLPDPAFGVAGKVDLLSGIPRLNASPATAQTQFGVSSPPVVYQDIVVIGNSVSDANPVALTQPPGYIRGYNVRTGALVWTFHNVPASGTDDGAASWLNDNWQTTGHANAWAPLSLDKERGWVFVPTGCPTSNYWGGHRPGNNEFSSSLIAIDALTGQRQWHFQCVHHDIWDYDLPCAPNLINVTVDGTPIEAVAQVSKQGYTYVFNRATGAPIWPIVETAVPQTTVAQEWTAATQPIPSKPPAFARQGVTMADLNDATPALLTEATAYINQYVWGPLFTPATPSAAGKIGTLNVPGNAGGANWGGAAADPETGFLYINQWGTRTSRVRLDAGTGNYAFEPNHLGLPERPLSGSTQRLFKGSYNNITAVNLNDGTIAWQVPNDGATGIVNWSSSFLMGDLLFYVSRGSTNLRVFDKLNGNILRTLPMPTTAGGAPMTYRVGDVQYVAVALGNAGSGTTHRIVGMKLSTEANPVSGARGWEQYERAGFGEGS